MTRLSNREKSAIIAAYRSGETSAEIGRRYGVNAGWVRKLAARAGVRVQAARKAVRKVKQPRSPKRRFVVLLQQVGSGRQSTAGYLKLM